MIYSDSLLLSFATIIQIQVNSNILYNATTFLSALCGIVKRDIWKNTAGMKPALKNLLNFNSIVKLNFERIRLLCSTVTFLPQEIRIALLSEIHFQHGLKFLILRIYLMSSLC